MLLGRMPFLLIMKYREMPANAVKTNKPIAGFIDEPVSLLTTTESTNNVMPKIPARPCSKPISKGVFLSARRINAVAAPPRIVPHRMTKENIASQVSGNCIFYLFISKQAVAMLSVSSGFDLSLVNLKL